MKELEILLRERLFTPRRIPPLMCRTSTWVHPPRSENSGYVNGYERLEVTRHVKSSHTLLSLINVSRVAGHLFRYVTNQSPNANSAFHPSGVGKWVPASAGKAKTGMVHSVSGWKRVVQVKLRDPLRTRAIYERLKTPYTRCNLCTTGCTTGYTTGCIVYTHL